MKIKRLFGLAAVASLAVLMTACGKTKKNKSILSDDYFNTLAVDLDEFKEDMKKKESVVEICSDKTYVAYTNNIYIVKDDDNYYFYNLLLEGQLIATIPAADYYSYQINGEYGYIRITFNKNADNEYGYAVYTLDGKEILPKTYCRTTPSVSSNGSETCMDGDSMFNLKEYRVYYSVTEGSTYAYHYAYFYKINEVDMTGYQSKTTYLTIDEYNEKFGKIKTQAIDGKVYGLKGYTIQSQGSTMYLFKGKKLINALGFGESTPFVTDGYMLYQTSKTVSSSDDYDLFYDGKYLEINTFSVNLKNSKVKKLGNFHYLIRGIGYEPVMVDGEIDSYLAQVLDFKKKKNADDSDFRMALFDGKGNIDVHEAMDLFGSDIVKVGKEYYSYNFSTPHSISQDSTVIYDKNGNVKKVYDAIYYDGIIASLNNDIAYFKDADGNIIYYLNNCSRIDAATYIGYDVSGVEMIVEIKDGSLIKADCSEYDIYNNMFTKISGTNVEFYTLNSTMTSIGFSYDSSIEEIDSMGYGFYQVTNSSTGKRKLVYFA